MNTNTDIKLSPACVAAEEYERRNPNRERSGTELYNAFMAGVSWQSQAMRDVLEKARFALRTAQAHAPCPLYEEAIEAIEQFSTR